MRLFRLRSKKVLKHLNSQLTGSSCLSFPITVSQYLDGKIQVIPGPGIKLSVVVLMSAWELKNIRWRIVLMSDSTVG